MAKSIKHTQLNYKILSYISYLKKELIEKDLYPIQQDIVLYLFSIAPRQQTAREITQALSGRYPNITVRMTTSSLTFIYKRGLCNQGPKRPSKPSVYFFDRNIGQLRPVKSDPKKPVALTPSDKRLWAIIYDFLRQNPSKRFKKKDIISEIGNKLLPLCGKSKLINRLKNLFQKLQKLGHIHRPDSDGRLLYLHFNPSTGTVERAPRFDETASSSFKSLSKIALNFFQNNPNKFITADQLADTLSPYIQVYLPKTSASTATKTTLTLLNRQGKIESSSKIEYTRGCFSFNTTSQQLTFTPLEQLPSLPDLIYQHLRSRFNEIISATQFVSDLKFHLKLFYPQIPEMDTFQNALLDLKEQGMIEGPQLPSPTCTLSFNYSTQKIRITPLYSKASAQKPPPPAFKTRPLQYALSHKVLNVPPLQKRRTVKDGSTL